MSEVKRYGNISYLVEATPQMVRLYPSMAIYTLASDFDAQRLRADTAEAYLQEACKTVEAVTASLAAAEQRIAKLETVLRSAVEWFDDGVGRSIAEFCKLQEMRAALNPNPNPEAESHE